MIKKFAGTVTAAFVPTIAGERISASAKETPALKNKQGDMSNEIHQAIKE